MPIAVVNRRYFSGVEPSGVQVDSAAGFGGAFDATVNIVNGGGPGAGNAFARTAEAAGTAWGPFASTGSTSVVSHGEQLPPTSDLAASVIGPQGTLTPYVGADRFIGTQTFTDTEFSGSTWYQMPGAITTFRNCRFIGSLGQTTYTLQSTRDGGAIMRLFDCEIITRTTTGATPRCLTMWGDGNVEVHRTIFRGGIDNVFFNPIGSAGLISTGDPFVPNARVWLDQCWFGDYQRVPNSHSDAIQMDGGGYMLITKCRMMGYTLPEGSDPLSVRISDPVTAELGGGVLITTQDSKNPSLIEYVAMRDSRAEGGNYTVDTTPDDGLPVVKTEMTDNLFGIRHRYGSLVTNGLNTNNRWGQTGRIGPTGTGALVTAGQLVPGSVAA